MVRSIIERKKRLLASQNGWGDKIGSTDGWVPNAFGCPIVSAG
jgi:hypothetical protein